MTTAMLTELAKGSPSTQRRNRPIDSTMRLLCSSLKFCTVVFKSLHNNTAVQKVARPVPMHYFVEVALYSYV